MLPLLPLDAVYAIHMSLVQWWAGQWILDERINGSLAEKLLHRLDPMVRGESAPVPSTTETRAQDWRAKADLIGVSFRFPCPGGRTF